MNEHVPSTCTDPECEPCWLLWLDANPDVKRLIENEDIAERGREINASLEQYYSYLLD